MRVEVAPAKPSAASRVTFDENAATTSSGAAAMAAATAFLRSRLAHAGKRMPAAQASSRTKRHKR